MTAGIYDRKSNIKYGMTGKNHSNKTKKKISEAKIGSKHTEESKIKIGKNNARIWLGKKMSKGHREKMSEAKKGKIGNTFGKHWKLSDKTKRKMSSSAFERFSNPENHYNWQGGKSFEPYPIKFNRRLKEEVRKRDDYTCQLCGKQQDELTGQIKKLAIHHINYNKQNCNKSNLVTLCQSCNSVVNKDRLDWMNYFQKYE